MIFADVINLAFHVQDRLISLHPDVDGATVLGSAYHAIVAAFATQGIWVQADIIYWLGASALSHWAPLLFLLAAMGGMLSMVLGSPPRNYVWFFLGPAIFHWLLYTTTDIHGVMWGAPMDSVNTTSEAEKRQMKEVWKLSEPGLRNSNYVNRNGITVSNNAKPSKPAKVASFFAWYDELLSSQIRWFINWTGVYWQDNNTSSSSTNLCGYAGSLDLNDTAWHVLSSIKWEVLEDLTSARAHSVHTRDAFVQFMASECGDALKKSIKTSHYIAAQNALGTTLSRSSELGSVLADSTGSGGGAKSASGFTYKQLSERLARTAIPVPRPLKRLMSTANKNEDGNYRTFLQGAGTNPADIEKRLEEGRVTCDLYFWMVVNAFRWEAGHVYWQAVTRKEIGRGDDDPSDLKAAIMRDQVVYALLYGWDVKKEKDTCLDFEEQNYFAVDMALVHLIRNEFAVAPQVKNNRYSSSQQSLQAVEGQARSVGSKAKYGELYTWAKMIPYVQGVLLYFLAMAYPFACILMVVPGWHKTLLTWASFYAWAKLWDLGFALVNAIERSVWATIGNNPDVASINGHIAKMQDTAKVNVHCKGGSIIGDGDCAVPQVLVDGGTSWENLVETFDKALLFASALDYDLLNSYYIYIMAALNFAVPAVTGQLVLGARAGASGMVNNMIGGVSGQAGAQAGQAFTARYLTGLRGAETNFQQQTAAKSQRKQGLGNSGQYAAAALSTKAMQGGIAESHQQMMGGIEQMRGTAAGYERQAFESGLGITSSGAKLGWSLMGGGRGRAGGRSGAGKSMMGGGGGRSGSGGGRSGSGRGSGLRGGGGYFSNNALNALEFGGKLAGADAMQRYLAADFEGNRNSKGHGIEAARLGARKSMDEAMSGRMGKLGQFQMAEDMYDASADYAQGIVNQAAAFGVSQGSVSPTQLSTDVDGMQGKGMLSFQSAGGWNTKAQDNFFMPQRLRTQADNQARAQTGLLNSIMQPRGLYGANEAAKTAQFANSRMIDMFSNGKTWGAAYDAAIGTANAGLDRARR